MRRAGQPAKKDVRDTTANPPQILITAQEAFPAFERRVLAARSHIVMGFRLFDPLTRLRSDAAREVGETWVDLLADALERGVRIDIHHADFDPVAAARLHRRCWRNVRVLCGLRELVGPKAAERLTVHSDLHPARTGALARVLGQLALITSLSACVCMPVMAAVAGRGRARGAALAAVLIDVVVEACYAARGVASASGGSRISPACLEKARRGD